MSGRVVTTPLGRYRERTVPGRPGVVEREWIEHTQLAERVAPPGVGVQLREGGRRERARPYLPAGPFPRVTRADARPERSERRRTARHEAAHAAAAYLLGWKVRRVEVYAAGGGDCEALAPRGLSRERRAADLAVIAAAAEAHVGFAAGDAYGFDRRLVDAARGRARDRLAGDAYQRDLGRFVTALVGSPRFRRVAAEVTDALLSDGGRLGERELGRLLLGR